ncbi:MAG: gluconate 2-dehydrogenase subunit 3 family protein [Gemmatimonadetes bacterium]|nr:gluconate 2-dehydrogenase subunit 3 family protein [Gemmatimonadota bacterium]
MERRDLLRALGAAAALTLLPRDAEAAWARLARAPGAPLRALNASQAAQVAALADVVLPRTDTPSATDVGVVAWVDLIVADYYKDAERTQFTEGLAAIDALAQGGTTGGIGYGPEAAASLIDALERGDRRAAAGSAWWRLKGLVLHGYFTSEKVQKEVLKMNIMPGKFDGDAPMRVPAGGHSRG